MPRTGTGRSSRSTRAAIDSSSLRFGRNVLRKTGTAVINIESLAIRAKHRSSWASLRRCARDMNLGSAPLEPIRNPRARKAGEHLVRGGPQTGELAVASECAAQCGTAREQGEHHGESDRQRACDGEQEQCGGDRMEAGLLAGRGGESIHTDGIARQSGPACCS